jgi:hypothetical protein
MRLKEGITGNRTRAAGAAGRRSRVRLQVSDSANKSPKKFLYKFVKNNIVFLYSVGNLTSYRTYNRTCTLSVWFGMASSLTFIGKGLS